MTDERPTVMGDQLLAYFATLERHRAEAVTHTLVAMTDRERHLVREAAVMGYVQGVRSVPGSHGQTIPADAAVLAQVIDACLHFWDLYPTFSSLTAAPDTA